jgi:hypothetical protein
MNTGKLLNDTETKNYLITVLTETISDYDLWKAERKLKTTEYDFENGRAVKMEYIDMIYRRLENTGLFTFEELCFYLYKLETVSTLRIYDKIGKINRVLNRKRITVKDKGFIYEKTK